MNGVSALILAVVLATASGAWAQEAIPTASNLPDGGAPAATPSDGPITISRDPPRDDRGPIPIGPCGGAYRSIDDGPPVPDKSPHGAVWAGVGTHGYREVGGTVCIPVGQDSHIAIAVDSTQWGRR